MQKNLQTMNFRSNFEAVRGIVGVQNMADCGIVHNKLSTYLLSTVECFIPNKRLFMNLTFWVPVFYIKFNDISHIP